MRPDDPRLDEEWPTGTFGHAPPPIEPKAPPRPIAPWTPEEQDEHWAELCRERGVPGEQRPHLRLVETTDATTADTEPERRSA